MDLTQLGWDGMDWIDLAQDRDQWRALVNLVMNLRIPQNAGGTQKVSFGNAVFAALISGRKYDVIPQNADCSRENNVYFGFSKQYPLSKYNVVIDLHLQIMLSDAG
jgi:hypothetical protein